MSSVPTILVVNPNTNASTTDMLVAVAEKAMDGSRYDVVGVTAASGPRMIVDAEALAEAAEHTVAAALSGIDVHRPCAVIIGAFGDPGVAALRQLVDFPVVGIGQAAVSTAARGGRRFAIATTTSLLEPSLRELVRHCSPDADFAGIFLTDSDPLVLARDHDASVFELGTAVDDAAAAGAEAVIIGGGPLSDSARQLALRTDVVIVEPVPSAALWVLERMESNHNSDQDEPNTPLIGTSRR